MERHCFEGPLRKGCTGSESDAARAPHAAGHGTTATLLEVRRYVDAIYCTPVGCPLCVVGFVVGIRRSAVSVSECRNHVLLAPQTAADSAASALLSSTCYSCKDVKVFVVTFAQEHKRALPP